MVQGLGGGSVSIPGGDFIIGDEGFEQRLQMRILKSAHKPYQGAPEFVHILGAFRKVIDIVNLRSVHALHFVNSELETVVVLVKNTFDPDEIVLLKGVDGFGDVVPHLGFDLPTTIAERERKVRLAIFLGFDLLRGDYEAGSDDLILKLRGLLQEEILHRLSHSTKHKAFA